MKTLLKSSTLLTVIMVGLLGFVCQCDTNRDKQTPKMKKQNLETFARLYGYARWFHPSDEAQEIDWDKFAVLGVQKIENIKSTAALRDTLYKLFSPVVQGLQIYDAQKPEVFNPEILSSPDPNAKPVAWQHFGVYLNDQSNVYKSIRTNKSEINKSNGYTIATKYFLESSYSNYKEVKFSGHFKTNKEGAKLFIQSFTSSGNNTKHEIPIDSHEWKKYELTLTIPKETVSIMYGFEVDGDLEVWADDFAFAVNNKGKWILADTKNMGFEEGKSENGSDPATYWDTSTIRHKFEVSDENPFSGNYCLKVYYTGKMFESMPQVGEVTKASIGNNLTCVVPLTLQTNGSATYPQTDTASLNRLKSELSEINISKDFNQQVNLASVLITWNVLQHFFPYFDVIDTDWNKILGETLESALSNKSKEDFFITLSRMIAQIDDGHGVIFNGPIYSLPLVRTEYIENKIVITASNDPALKRGDIIHEINGKPALEELDEKEKIISGSPQLRRYRALNVLSGKFESDIKANEYVLQLENNNPVNKPASNGIQLVIERDAKKQNVTVTNLWNRSIFFNQINDRKYLSETILEIEPGIYYINMGKCTVNEFERQKGVLAKAKAVIYDQRGSSSLNFIEIVPYLIEKQVSSTWWNIPQTVYPDRKAVEFHTSNWAIQPKQPLFKSKSIIINIPSVVSAGETMMGIIDHYKLATTIGEPTAGCNGNVNRINLPCGYQVMWTGMKVLKHDGSQLYLKGFEPDYPVHKTIQAVKEGRDEFLEKALEVAKQKNDINSK